MNEEEQENGEGQSGHHEGTEEEERIKKAETAADNALKKKLAQIEAKKNLETKKKNVSCPGTVYPFRELYFQHGVLLFSRPHIKRTMLNLCSKTFLRM